MQSSRFGFFRARYAATGIYAASTAKRVASQKSPCKNEERRKEEEENGERYRLKTVKSGSTLSPVQAGEADSCFSLSLCSSSLDAQSDKRRMRARSEKRSAWRIAAAVRSPRRFVNRPIAVGAGTRAAKTPSSSTGAKTPQKSDATRFGYPTSRVPAFPAGRETRVRSVCARFSTGTCVHFR